MLKRPGDALARLLQRFDVDRAVLFGLALRGWSVLSGVGTALLIASRFSPAIQGYHFTFIGLMSLQVFLELGLEVCWSRSRAMSGQRFAWRRAGFVERRRRCRAWQV